MGRNGGNAIRMNAKCEFAGADWQQNHDSSEVSLDSGCGQRNPPQVQNESTGCQLTDRRTVIWLFDLVMGNSLLKSRKQLGRALMAWTNTAHRKLPHLRAEQEHPAVWSTKLFAIPFPL